MTKIDRRRNYFLCIDTETVPVDKDFDGVDPYNMWVYDVGVAVIDKHGNVYETFSFVNADIFIDEKELMKSAYYADKIPDYWEDIKNGKRVLTSFYNIRKTIMMLIDKYEIEKVFAQYLDTNNFNANQIRFIDKIISYLRINGTMLDIGTLYESPFTDLSSDGIDGVFSTKDADNIIYLIKINYM